MAFCTYFLLLLTCISYLHTAESLTCYTCQNVNVLAQCTTNTTCGDRQVCFKKTTKTLTDTTFELGCKSYELCGGSASSGATNLIGRGIQTDKRQVATNCHECCAKDMCNVDLCSHRKPATCVDDETVDCAQLSSLLNICNDVDHAKTICPDFCGLCNVVDGEWASWTNWSTCDVTCDVGTQTRTRSCTNPPPENGGAYCIGNTTKTQKCVQGNCPINGGWSRWSPWGECSATCDVGIQRRDRSCSNPYPDKYGDHCFGESRDDRICMSNPCADGGWSLWQPWEQCSVTCGGGNRRRHRLCDNPTPSPFGRSCIGTNEQTELCNNAQCRADAVAFHVLHVSSLVKNVNIFTDIILNEGHGYSKTTGYFVAPVSGVYSFAVQMCTLLNQLIAFNLVKVNPASIEVDIEKSVYINEARDNTCTSSNAIVRLNNNDRVAVKMILGSYADLYQNIHRQCSFSGVKVSN